MRVQALAEYYENQTDAEAIAELAAAFEDGKSAMIQVPYRAGSVSRRFRIVIALTVRRRAG